MHKDSLPAVPRLPPGTITVAIRGINRLLWRDARTLAVKLGMTTGELTNHALLAFIADQNSDERINEDGETI